MTRQPGQPPAAGDNKAGKICRPPPPGAFAKTSGADTVNADAAPDFERQKLGVGLVISAPARDDGNLVTALDQPEGDLGEVLPGSHHVRMEGLVEKEEGHSRWSVVSSQ